MILSALLLIAHSTCLPVKPTATRLSRFTETYRPQPPDWNSDLFRDTYHFRRQDTASAFVQLDLYKKGLYYFTKFDIGTPEQPRDFMVVTSSGDLWINAEPAHRSKFDYKKSQSFRADKGQPQFSATIGNYGHASGFWGYDVVSAFGSHFEVPLGVATESNMVENLGLGLSSGAWNHTTFTQTLKSNGMIKSNSYSLWLAGAESADNKGLLFGAIDHSKYEGDLTLLPLVDGKSFDMPASFGVNLKELQGYIEPGVLVVEIDQPILIDSGSVFSQFPDAFVDTLGRSLNGQFSEALNLYVIDCQTKGQFIFDFNGAKIELPLSDFLVPSGNRKTSDKCSLTMQKQGDGPMIMGSTLLRKLYLAVDLDAGEVALAKAVAPGSAKQPAIEIIENGIPQATPIANYNAA